MNFDGNDIKDAQDLAKRISPKLYDLMEQGSVDVYTHDGETFMIKKKDISITLSRAEIELIVDEAGILLMITQERDIVPVENGYPR